MTNEARTRYSNVHTFATSAANGITNDEGIYYLDDYEAGVRTINNFCTGYDIYPYV